MVKRLNIGCHPLVISTAALAFLAACQPKMDDIDPRCLDPELGLVFEDQYTGKFAVPPPPPPECPPELMPVPPIVDDPDSPDGPGPNGPPDRPDPPEEKQAVFFARPGYSGGSDRVSGNTAAEANQPGIDAVNDGTAAVGDATFSRPGGG